jgi:hypothetical protein
MLRVTMRVAHCRSGKYPGDEDPPTSSLFLPLNDLRTLGIVT